MMKGKNRLLAIVMLVALLTMPLGVQAEGTQTVVDPEIAPRYVVYCEGSQYQGRHDALASGWGDVICTTDSSKNFSGVAFQCTRCHQVIITQREPSQGIGKYAEWNPGYDVGNFTVMRVSKVKSTSAKTLPAYRFRYS